MSQLDKRQIALEHSKLGNEYQQKARYEEAILYYGKAISIYWELKEMEEYVNLNKLLFNCLRESGKSQIAINRAEAVLRQLISTYGDSHLFVGHIYNTLGVSHWELANYPLALQYHEKALTILLNELGDFHIEVANTYTTLGAVYGYMGNYKEQIVVSSKALKIQLYHKEESGLTYFNLGYAYRMVGQVYEAIDHYQQALKIYLKLYGNKHPYISMCYTALGGAYSELGDKDKQITYLKQSENIALAAYSADHPELAHLYGHLATFYMKTGDLTKALLYYQRGLHINQKAYGEAHDFIADFLAQIGYLFFRQEKYQETQAYLEKALAIYLTVYGNPHLSMNYCYRQLGFVYAELNQTHKARSCFQQALQICLDSVGAIHSYSIHCYLDFGIYYDKQKQFDKALAIYQQALDAQMQLWGNRHSMTAKIYRYLAYNYQSQKEYNLAIDHYEKGLQSLQLQQGVPSFQVINLNNYKEIDYPDLLPLLQGKAAAVFQKYRESKKITDLQRAFHLYESTLLLLTKISKSYQSDFSKLFLSKENILIYSRAVTVVYAVWQQCLEVSFLKKLFSFIEKAKANVLLAAVKDDFAKIHTKIPSELLQKEKGLKSKLTFLEKQIAKEEAKGEQQREAILLQWKSQFFDLHQEYLQLIQQFEQDYPDYYQLKYETKTASIEELQQNLTENQVMVNYFVGDSRYYLFLITSNDFEVHDFEKPDDFEVLVEGFLEAIHEHKLEDYAAKAYELYQYLLQPIEHYLIDAFGDFGGETLEEAKSKELIIIPHDILSYLPFEALLCSSLEDSIEGKLEKGENAYQYLDYLLLHCEVSYHYSATLWHYLQNVRGERAAVENDFVGFAPVYESVDTAQNKSLQSVAKEVGQWATRSEALRSNGTWTPLPHSKVEAEVVASLFAKKGLKTRTFLHEQATKEQFQEVVENSRFLLIAAHGVVNDEQPKLSGLVFYPSQLLAGSKTAAKVSTREVETFSTVTNLENSWNGESTADCILSMEETYHLNLSKTDLVVLSSCESGIGELAKGEGMMAVNRGFLYAGAKNVVSTLFKVYDRPSSLLTQYLFEGALEGKGYTAALREAKLKLLKQEEVDVKSWCGFVLIG